jgi:hypothetical protein
MASLVDDAIDWAKKKLHLDDPNAKAPGGEDPETHKKESTDEAVDRMSGDIPPKQNQSTDHANGY